MSNRIANAASRERLAVMVAVFSVMFGVAVAWLIKWTDPRIDGVVIIALLFLPLAAYVISSGRLTEFKGPGGIEAKFAEAAEESVPLAPGDIKFSDPQVVAKEGVRDLLQRKANEIDESEPVIMSLTIGANTSSGGQYALTDVSQYIDVLSQFRHFKFVVFVDDSEKYVAHMPAWALKQMLQLGDLAGEFLDAVNRGHRNLVFRFPGVSRKVIQTKATNIEALKEMQDQNVEALIVIDEQRTLRGVVEREQVLGRLMLALVQQK